MPSPLPIRARRWRLLVRRTMVSMVFGAITTVLVAWAFVYGHTPTSQHGSSPSVQPRWQVARWSGIGSVEYRSVTWGDTRHDFGEESIPSWCIATGLVPRDHPNLATTWWSDSAMGWPMLALRSRAELDTTLRSTFPSRNLRKVQWGIEAQWIHGRNFPVFIPLRPIWTGFIIDTIVYAAIWLGMMAIASLARKQIRRSRQRCVECGYSLRGLLSSQCPECGTPRVPMPPGTSTLS